MTTRLTTPELAERLDAALAVEEDCRGALERLQIESATAGEEPSAKEREAEATLSRAVTARERAEAALTASQHYDEAQKRAAARDAIEAEDLRIVTTLAAVEKAAGKLSAAAEAYSSAYDAFVKVLGTAQGMIFECDRITDRDTSFPRPHVVTAAELARVNFGRAADLPGAANLFGTDLSTVSKLPEVFASYTAHFRRAIGRELAA